MKKIKVIVKEKTLLELAEDAEKGDLIDLNELAEVDSSYLEAIIDSGKDKVYASKLEEFKRTLDAENLVKVNELQSTIEALKKEKDNALIIKEKEVEKQFLNEISELKKKIAEMNLEKKNEIDKLLGQIVSISMDKYKFLPLFYNHIYETIGKTKKNTYKYDCMYVGTAHPQKYYDINRMARGLKSVMPNHSSPHRHCLQKDFCPLSKY